MNLKWTKFDIAKNFPDSEDYGIGIDRYYSSRIKAGPFYYELLIQHLYKCDNGHCNRYLLNIFVLGDPSVTAEKLQKNYLGAWEGHAFTLKQVKEESKKVLLDKIQDTINQLSDVIYKERYVK